MQLTAKGGPLENDNSQTMMIGEINQEDELVKQTLSKLGPAVVQPGALFALMESEPKDLVRVRDAIRSCPTLTARVLGVINSAAFGISRQISSIERAVTLLGPNRARAVAMAYGLRMLTESSSLPKEIADSLWANSLQKAIAARKFCELTDPQQADDAYSMALIQDIGLPMLISVNPDVYTEQAFISNSHSNWCSWEKKQFGFDHTAVSQGLLREWHASRKLQKAVINHHDSPLQASDGSEAPMVQWAVFMASLLPHLNEEPDARCMEWLQNLHTRFMAKTYPTLDRFMVSVAEEARTLYNNSPKIESTDIILRKLTATVTTNAINHTAKLCRLEKDVDQTKQGLNDLKFQAFTDPLTKVLNRRGFTQLAERRLEMASVQGTGVCCMLIDLDDFKNVNDTHGHDAGDLLLKGLARVFRKKLGPNDLIGRLGGDEFAVLIAGIDRARAYAVSQKLAEGVEGKDVRLRDDLTIRSHFTLGSVYTDICLDDLTIDMLLTLADQAMYQKKKNGKHGLSFVIYPDETPEEIHLEKNPQSITRGGERIE
ncbi:MAG TPA: hypothetical protein DCM28_19105 [Phycisphaerales bacterium]|nr:hypothetical protein [Phycisphaerales bacterium]HCD34712.1 hypothetical protein [Phycisphaerales bacterium]|tara:strand:- start:1233 stop:2861 length:1629 start_codon:yes stop_codon:yes gene_type:complete